MINSADSCPLLGSSVLEDANVSEVISKLFNVDKVIQLIIWVVVYIVITFESTMIITNKRIIVGNIIIIRMKIMTNRHI